MFIAELSKVTTESDGEGKKKLTNDFLKETVSIPPLSTIFEYERSVLLAFKCSLMHEL